MLEHFKDYEQQGYYIAELEKEVERLSLIVKNNIATDNMVKSLGLLKLRAKNEVDV